LRCEAISIIPQPTDNELGKYYSRDYLKAWGDYDENEVFVSDQKIKSFEQFFQYLGDLKDGAKVLECGCAAGALLKLLTLRGYEAFGFDINEYAIAKASKFIPKDHLFVSDDISKLPLLGGSLDAVFIIDNIEHLRDPVKTIQYAHRLLKKNGYLIITTPDASHLYPRLLRKYYWYYSAQHIHVFNRHTFPSLIEKHGFRLCTLKSFKKALSVLYLSKIFVTYYSSAWRLFDKFLLPLLPGTLQRKVFYCGTGELLLIMRSNGDD
jgi:SAM-dependent methyltransferase